MAVIKQHGQVGYLRLFKNCYCTCETKEEGDRFDLRITEPFDELLAISESYKTDELDFSDHKLVPFIVILMQELAKWKNNVSFPKNYKNILTFLSMREIHQKLTMKLLSSDSRLSLRLSLFILRRKITRRLMRRLVTRLKYQVKFHKK